MVLVLSHPSLPQTTYQTALQMDMASSSRPRATGFRPSSSWSPQEDQTLIEARARGLNWGPIAENYFPGKTANACRKRHERLAEHRHNENWDALRLEALARTYQEVREEMWSILASRLNEKWNVVEQKCMEKGVKNLSATARSANRRLAGAHSDSSGASFDDGLEWPQEMNAPSTARSYQQEWHALPPLTHHPQYHQQQRGYTTGPSIASMLSPPNLGYR